MDKLSLHESLRIYIPNLLLASVLYYLSKQSLDGLGNIAIPAIFVGFALNPVYHKLSSIYFKRMTFNHSIVLNNCQRSFYEHQKNIFEAKFKLINSTPINPFCLIDSKNFRVWNFLAFSHFAKIADSPETASFRMPKSFGVMCFNLFTASILAPFLFFVAALMFNISISSKQIEIILASIASSALFLKSASAFLKSSLERQLYYWAALSNDEMITVVSYLNIKQSIE